VAAKNQRQAEGLSGRLFFHSIRIVSPAREETKGGWPQRQRPKYRARSRLWRLTKNFQRTLQLRAPNAAELQLAFDIQVTSAQFRN
jgi:hypothetical protein